MSERPGTADAVVSRLRRPAGRLRDMPIWSKLGLIMLVPTLATIFVGTSGLLDHIDEAAAAEQARTMAALTQSAGSLADQLQDERGFAVMTLTARNETDRAAALKLYQGQQPEVDGARQPYAQQRAALTDLPPKLDTLLVRFDRNAVDLAPLRNQVATDTKSVTDVSRAYTDLIADLLNLRDSAAQLAGDAALSDRIRTAAAVARNKEFLSQQRVVVHQILGQRTLTNELRKAYTATRTGQEQALQTMRSVATDAENNRYDDTVIGPAVRQAANYNAFIEARTSTDLDGLTFDAGDWDNVQREHADLLREVERDLDDGVLQAATDRRDAVQREVFLETSLLLGMLLLAILFAWLVARSMARSLRELRQGALTVAQYGLPHAVGRLRDPALTGSQLTPAQIADQIAEPLPVRSRDEFGQVTEAFNAVHLEAVRTAAEQAALRSSVSTMFVNLARRSQILVDRLIGHLDRLERGEEDPDRLAELFQLDHLATRMRRNDENLLVLAGADSTRVQREPAALIDVLRAAQSEVEHYTRIEFGNIDRDIEVAAHAVNDMVHLVAELFDNATAFSPPDSHVVVDARRTGDRAVLYVEDRGIGISPEQLRDLNERLANPPMVDVAVSRMMGLVVVARLANRHGVRVQLRPAPERGTVADCTLPAAVLVPLAVSGRAPGASRGQENGRDYPVNPNVPPRSPFGAPLALEGNPGDQSASRPFDPNPPLVGGGMLGRSDWSDTPGGNALSNNGNGYHPVSASSGAPVGAQPYAPPPVPYGNDPELPRRRFDDEHQAGSGATIPRQLPPNPENQLRGPYVPPVSAPPISAPPVSAPPVSGRPVSVPPVSGPPVSAPPVSGPPVSGPPFSGRPVSVPPVSAPPVSAPPVSGRPVSVPPVTSAPPHASLVSSSGSYPVVPPPTSAPSTANGPGSSVPPAWPPVAAELNAPTAPAVPESLAAALDMTAEIPRLRPGAGPNAAAPTGAGQRARIDDARSGDADDERTPHEQRTTAKQAAELARRNAATQAAAAREVSAAQAETARRESTAGPSRFSDETMELPIFRELESAWFRTDRTEDAKPANGTPPTAEPTPGPGQGAVSAQRYSTAEPARTAVPQQAGPAGSGNTRVADMSMPAGDNEPGAGRGNAAGGWRTAADEGWQAALAAAEIPVETTGTTSAGLPKRTPMAQLVPGGVDRSGPSVQRRTPEAVRGLLSAYHRGVQRGRSKDHPTAPDGSSGGPSSSQAGKEHDA